MKDKIKIFSKYYTIDDISNNDTNYCLVNIGGVITFVHKDIEHFEKFDLIMIYGEEYIILGYNFLNRSSINSAYFELTCRSTRTNEYHYYSFAQLPIELLLYKKQQCRHRSANAIIVE
jgi:hypothetical protein